jgi:hypothetical protein
MNRFLYLAALLTGLAAVGWVGIGYIGSNPLALAMTLVIAAFYVMGALELHRFHQATTTLGDALAAVPADLPALSPWLDRLHPSLQNPVRQRIEGERVGLPVPSMTPYLVGLLVLLGMLGTFLGMVVTLKGAVIALESTTDLQAVRASLAAPVKGLGVAFGTSVAGVCASAMLGLLSALCRRARVQAVQRLDQAIATGLRVFSLAHQRDQTFKALQAQAEAMPLVVDRVQALMAQLERQQDALNERLLAGQDGFYRHAEAAYSGLASAVDRSLKDSLTESARAAGAVIGPVVEAAMAGIARETTALHGQVADTVRLQLDGVSERFGTAVDRVSDTWKESLDQHRRTSDQLAGDTRTAWEGLARSFEGHAASLLATVDRSHADLQGALASRDEARLAAWTQSLEAMAATLQREWQQAGAQATGRHEEIGGTLAQTAREVAAQAAGTQAALASFVDGFERQSALLLATVDRSHLALQSELASRDEARLAAWTQSLEAMAAALQREWQQAGAQATGRHEKIGETLAQTAREVAAQAAGTQAALASFVDGFERQSASLLSTVDRSHGAMQSELALRDEARLAAWSQSLEAMAATLQREWRQAGAEAQDQQAQICRTLDETARGIAAQAGSHARDTLAEIGRLMETAAEAPRAAAEVIGQLRQKLSDSIAQDNQLLEERSRIMGTVSALLDAINHASTEQRGAIDSLVASSEALLERAGSQFSEKLEAESGKLAGVAAQITGGAVEVSSLGEAFGFAVQLFSDSNEKLMDKLQRLEGSLGSAMARSDEQMAYYVAQAREIVDLSLMSQKQIVDDLQQFTRRQAAVAGEA